MAASYATFDSTGKTPTFQDTHGDDISVKKRENAFLKRVLPQQVDDVPVTWSRRTLLCTLIVVIICILAESWVMIMEAELRAALVDVYSDIDEREMVLAANSNFKVSTTYHAVFQASFVFWMFMTYDAIKYYNLAQVIACNFYIAGLFVYSLLQIVQIKKDTQEFTYEGHEIVTGSFLASLVTLPCVIALYAPVFAYLTRRLHHDFGWRIFRIAGGNRTIDKVIGLVLTQVSRHGIAIIGISIAMAAFIAPLIGYFGVRRESGTLMTLFMFCYLGLIAFVGERVWAGFTRKGGNGVGVGTTKLDEFDRAKIPFCMYAGVAIVLLMGAMVWGSICWSNFGKGLKQTFEFDAARKSGDFVNINMGRRKKNSFEDDYDSSDSGGGGGNDKDEFDMHGMDADERDEARLFQNPGRRRGRRFTKEDAALGIFADDDADGQRDDGPSGRGLGSGIAFVKTDAVSQEDSDVDMQPDDGSDDEEGSDASEGAVDMRQPRDANVEEDEEMESERPRMGLGDGQKMDVGLGFADFGPKQSSARAGLGASNSTQTQNTQEPSKFASKLQRKEPTPVAPKKAPIVLDARQKAANATRLNPKPDKEFMKFDKDGKGLSFLLKMGYKPGSGLGKDGVGIVNPIDVKLRPQKMGIGHKGFDERTNTVKLEQAMKRAERGETGDSDNDENEAAAPSKKDKVAKVSVDQWKRGNKKKVSYKTADELLKEQQDTLAPAARAAGRKTKIIDMTGAQARELENMAEATSVSRIAALKEAASHLVELRYNVRTMASEAELDLVRLSKAMTLEANQVSRADSEISAMKKRIELLDLKKVRLKQVIELAGHVVEEGKKLERKSYHEENASESIAHDMDVAFGALFRRIHTDFFDEYVEHRLDTLVVGAMAPLIKKMLSGWVPLQNPKFGLENFRNWRILFRFSVKKGGITENGCGSSRSNAETVRSMTPFESMMYNIWLPKVRQDVNNNWSPRNPDALTILLESWYPSSPTPEIIITGGLPELANASAPHLLPPWVFANIINQLIVDPVRHKLSIYFMDWHPSHSQGLSLLKPWADVLSRKKLQSLITKGVLPKLVATLRHEFQVNPAAQNNTALEHVLEWRSLIPQTLLSHLLETEFFPKWIQILWLWLSSPNVSYDEVSRWYSAWKSFFPEEVLDWPGMVEGFKVGLDLMNRSLSLREGESLGSVPRLVPMAEREELRAKLFGNGDKNSVTGKPELMRRKETAIGFQELLERTAAKSGLALLPTDRTHTSGKPVFKLVGEMAALKKQVLFYMDDGVLFVYMGGAVGDEGGVWEATAIDKVVGMALGR
ncbi:GC-rich sequence DNA-binding factor-like protein-domain-containing protein [Chytriomyces cf. hyalinus JEL632]|nr:GC-rich sequence DNA-binding factor-like protein-domain-containing protein [Chytriomyces cf. hyalinus JEL632]